MRLTKETNLYRDHAVRDGVDDAAKVATNYLDYDQQTGLTLGYVGTSERAVITSGGMEIYDGLNDQIAQFKAVTRLGTEDLGNLTLDYHSLQLQDVDGNTYVHFSDARSSQRTIEIVQRFTVYYTSTSTEYVLTNSVYEVISVTVDDVVQDPSRYEINYRETGGVREYYLRFNYTLTMYSTIVITYTTKDRLRAYSLGTRKSNYKIGNDSFIVGHECIAQDDYSLALGYQCEASGVGAIAQGANCKAQADNAFANGEGCVASGRGSSAIGIQCTASGNRSHAKGSYCTASGYESYAVGGMYCEASGDYSYAFGYNAVASGNSSFVIGNGRASGEDSFAIGSGCIASSNGSSAIGKSLEATGTYQQVLGKYNVTTTTPILIVGGGSGSYSARKNAMTLNDNGNMTIAGTLTQSSDKRLKYHRAYLSDQQNEVNEFINRLKPAWFEKDEQKHLGFYAQDVQQTDRWQCMVDTDTNGYLTLGYTELLAPLVAYCQNLEQKVESLEQRIERLEQLLNQ